MSIFDRQGIRPGGHFIFQKGHEEEGVIHGELGNFLNGGTTGKGISRVTDVTQTTLGPIEEAGGTYHILVGSEHVDNDYGTEERAKVFADVYRKCSAAGLNPPKVYGVEGTVVKFEPIEGQEMIAFLIKAGTEGLINEHSTFNIVNAITRKCIDDLVTFQFLELPVKSEKTDYSSMISKSFEDLKRHFHLDDRALKSMGIDVAALKGELELLGQKLGSQGRYRMRDADLSNIMMDNYQLSREFGTGINAVDVLRLAIQGKIREAQAINALSASMRHIDLDRAQELSFGPDDFIRSISSIKGEHPLVMREGFLGSAVAEYTSSIKSRYGDQEAIEMKKRFREGLPEAEYFIRVRRGGLIASGEYQDSMKKLIECTPDSEHFNKLLEDTYEIECRIASNFSIAQRLAEIHPEIGSELNKLSRFCFLMMPTRKSIYQGVMRYHSEQC